MDLRCSILRVEMVVVALVAVNDGHSFRFSQCALTSASRAGERVVGVCTVGVDDKVEVSNTYRYVTSAE